MNEWIPRPTGVETVVVGMVLALATVCGVHSEAEGAQTLFPTKDGTLVDGGIFGPFDGVADDADWTFNETSYEGSITLATSTPESSLEHRLVWEYNLATVTLDPPVSATLFFTIRGAAIFPFPDVEVFVYSYPADLTEMLDDFFSGPTVFQGSATVVPFQPPTQYSVDVTNAVSEALFSGTDKVAFRFQIDPGTEDVANQAFIDALDSDPNTKPKLVIDEFSLPGDVDGDGDADLDDYAGFPACHLGPDVIVTIPCRVYDFDSDLDVDLGDFQLFQTYFGGLPPH